ncbi:MAG: hypothetical protein DWQ30_08665 [Acidobacteria bacterium]|nr:MAG: hypothetical protein DWQ30_08665 [Acidobacteriota bacterium]
MKTERQSIDRGAGGHEPPPRRHLGLPTSTSTPCLLARRAVAVLCALLAPIGAGAKANEPSSAKLLSPYSLPSDFDFQTTVYRHGEPVDGLFDVAFELWDSRSGGELLGRIDRSGLEVAAGDLRAALDFGDVAMDGDTWLAVRIRPEDAASYVQLGARQRLRGAGGCTVNEDVRINGPLFVDAAGPQSDVKLFNHRLRLAGNGVGGLRFDTSTLQTSTTPGAPGALVLNRLGGTVAMGLSASAVGSTSAALVLPAGPATDCCSGGSLRVGTGQRTIAFDASSIQAQSADAPSDLFLNFEGGTVQVGPGDLDIGLGVDFNAADEVTVDITCSTGTHILAGGCISGSGPIGAMYPIDRSTWRCSFDGTGFALNQAFAICARLEY